MENYDRKSDNYRPKNTKDPLKSRKNTDNLYLNIEIITDTIGKKELFSTDTK